MASITLQGVSKRFGGGETAFAALSALDLAIADNQFVTLLGPSGCGKTTTLRLIAGYLVPDSGTIRVDDRLVSEPSGVVRPEARGMGMVFQNYAVWPHKTVYENVVFGLKLRKIPAADARTRVEQALGLMNLVGLENRYPNELSGGQQQRVALARSLVVEPSILLLDEPLSNLDAKLRERMRGELKDLQRRTGITFVYVTHDQSEALALSDMIAVMHAGRLQQYGTPAEVYGRPANRVVADFMGTINLLPAKVVEARAGNGTVETLAGVRLDVALPDGLNPGAPVDVAIRPEDVRLHKADAAETPNGTIRDRMFLGSAIEYQVASGGIILRVQTHPSQQFADGEAIVVELDAAHCNVFAGHEPNSAGDATDRRAV